MHTVRARQRTRERKHTTDVAAEQPAARNLDSRIDRAKRLWRFPVAATTRLRCLPLRAGAGTTEENARTRSNRILTVSFGNSFSLLRDIVSTCNTTLDDALRKNSVQAVGRFRGSRVMETADEVDNLLNVPFLSVSTTQRLRNNLLAKIKNAVQYFYFFSPAFVATPPIMST